MFKKLILNKQKKLIKGHTNEDFEPWWYVDLGDNYAISQVTITNRDDCCSVRLNNFKIFVGSNFKIKI